MEELRQFDFWLGKWNLTWEGGAGTNVIEAVFDGRAIVERFDGRPGTELQGMSVSVYAVDVGVWRQTWVDSDGRYLDFAGGLHDQEMDLRREGTLQGEPALYRMLWHEIAADSLRWNWECSVDDGASWRTLWAITYQRQV